MGLPRIIATLPYAEEECGTQARFVAFADKFISETMAKKGEVAPVWFLVSPAGMVIIGSPWDSESDKKIAIALVRKMLVDLKVERYFLASEVWLAAITKNTPEDVAKQFPAQRADRKEMVMLTVFERGGDGHTSMYDIIRIDKTKPRLRISEESKSYSGWQGRMFNLFEPPKKPN
jgi:hypothetical protein